MKSERPKYLAHRLVALALAALLLGGALLAGLCYATAKAGGWVCLPLCLGAGAIAGLLLAFWLWVLRPFGRLEHRNRLFLAGVAPDPGEAEPICLSPADRQLWESVEGLLDSSELMKLNKRQAQYLALQNQINPHFLYNTLESIRSEALIAGLTQLAEMTEALASFFRYTISKVENLVSVEDELQNCETYFKIQQYRFAERLALSIECDEQERERIYRCRLPKLTMQPILENSIIHGTERKLGTGHLKIHLEMTGTLLLIRVSDDGVGMDEQTLAQMNQRLQHSAWTAVVQEKKEKSGGIALLNVNNRIHLLFGEEYGLRVFSMPGMGTDVEIVLPAITSDRDVPNKEALGSP